MASGFGTFTSSTYFTSGNGRGYLRAWVSQTVDSSARTVKITVDAYLSYYRNAGGNWNPGTSSLFYNHSSGNYIKATVDGSTNTSGQNLGLKGNNTTLNVGSYYTTRNSAVAANTVAAQSKSTTFNYNDNGDAITKSWSASIKYGSTTMSVSGNVTTDSIAAAYSAPTGLSVSVDSISDTSADLNVSITSYGNPASSENRYLLASLGENSTYTGGYKYSTAPEKTSATITVSNASSCKTEGYEIIGNTQYYYGAYVTNTKKTAETISGTLITLPARINSIDITKNHNTSIELVINHDEEGTDDTVYTEYSTDQTTWTSTTDTPSLTVSSPTTYYFRRRNSSGSMPAFSILITPKEIMKTYASVNGQSKKIKTLYGSVSGESKRIKKLYASVNGRSKLIYFDDYDAWSQYGAGTESNPYIISTQSGTEVETETT